METSSVTSRTVASDGGVNANIEGSIAPKETDVKPASTAGPAPPRGVIETSSGRRVWASIAIVTSPTNVVCDEGVKRST